MPSTYTINTGIEKPATGEQSGTWGDTVNTNSDILDRALNGVGSISLSGTTHTLSTTDGTLSDGMYRVLVFGGSPSGTNTVTISPNDAQKLYFVQNDSGESVVLTQGSGGNVTVADGNSAIVYADGAGATAAVVDVTANFNVTDGTVTSVSGTGTVNGLSLSGTVTSSGNLTLGGTFSATVSEISDLTATAAELNILDGVTATTAELNYLDVTTLGTSQASKAVTADANGNIKLTEEVQAVCYLETAISVPSTTIDCDEGNVFYKTISANTTFTFDYSGVSLTTDDAYAFTLILTVSGTRTVTWPASVDWAEGTAPDAPASGETDVYVFVTRDGGTTWYGFQAGDAMS